MLFNVFLFKHPNNFTAKIKTVIKNNIHKNKFNLFNSLNTEFESKKAIFIIKAITKQKNTLNNFNVFSNIFPN